MSHTTLSVRSKNEYKKQSLEKGYYTAELTESI